MAGSKRGGARGGGFKKTFTKKRAEPSDDDETQTRASKKTKPDDEDEEGTTIVPKLEKDDEGNDYVALNTSGKRRATVSEFKNKVYVSIREYYVTDSGESKPGKKGISLSIENYNALLAAAPLIESVLAKKDVKVVRPDYEGNGECAEVKEQGMAKDEDDGVVKSDDDGDDEEE